MHPSTTATLYFFSPHSFAKQYFDEGKSARAQVLCWWWGEMNATYILDPAASLTTWLVCKLSMWLEIASC